MNEAMINSGTGPSNSTSFTMKRVRHCRGLAGVKIHSVSGLAKKSSETAHGQW